MQKQIAAAGKSGLLFARYLFKRNFLDANENYFEEAVRLKDDVLKTKISGGVCFVPMNEFKRRPDFREITRNILDEHIFIKLVRSFRRVKTRFG